MSVNVSVMEPIGRFYQVYNDHDLSQWDTTMADDYVGNVNGQTVPSREVGKGFVGMLLTAFPDINYQLEDTLQCGDNKVVTRWKATATHTGDFFGMPPTNKHVTMLGITIFQVQGDRIAALWDVWDQAGLMAQLNG